MSGEQETFQCPVCGLHYRDDKTAKKCEAYCKANKACSLEIAKQAIEYQEAEQEYSDES